VKTFLQAGVPLSKVALFRDLLEGTGYHLTNWRYLFDLIPFVLEEDKQINKVSMQGKRFHFYIVKRQCINNSYTSEHRALRNLETRRPCVVAPERSDGTVGPEGL